MISFPLALSEFFANLEFTTAPVLDLIQRQKVSEDAAGNVLTALLGTPKWWGKYTLNAAPHAVAKEREALFKALIARNGTFLAYDLRAPYPAYDPKGNIISGSTPTVKTKGSNNRSISIQGLPNHYVVTAGDKLSITDGSGKRALLEAMETVEATGAGGNTPEFEVQPFLVSWIAIGQTVDLVKPLGKFRIVTGTYKPANLDTEEMSNSSGTYFEAMSIPA
jgi:hypothetical protein